MKPIKFGCVLTGPHWALGRNQPGPNSPTSDRKRIWTQGLLTSFVPTAVSVFSEREEARHVSNELTSTARDGWREREREGRRGEGERERATLSLVVYVNVSRWMGELSEIVVFPSASSEENYSVGWLTGCICTLRPHIVLSLLFFFTCSFVLGFCPTGGRHVHFSLMRSIQKILKKFWSYFHAFRNFNHCAVAASQFFKSLWNPLLLPSTPTYSSTMPDDFTACWRTENCPLARHEVT